MLDFTGYGENILTFKADENTAVGYPATVIGNGTVAAAENGTPFCGVISTVRNGAAAVIMSGYIVLPYSGDAPSYGYIKLVSDGNGGVMAGENGKPVTVIEVDEDAGTVGFIF